MPPRLGAVSADLLLLFPPLLLVLNLVSALLVAGGVLALGVAILGAWWLFAPAPRRWRTYRRARRTLEERDWEATLRAAEGLGNPDRLSLAWRGRQRNLRGEAHRLAGDAALEEGRYEECLDHYLESAELLDLDPEDVRSRVLSTMQREIRRLFALGTGAKETAAVLDLIARLLKIQSPCAEASFWQGLCHIRALRMEQAQASLTAAYGQAGKEFLDPPLYLGALLLHEGRPQEALRYLSEAHRLDGNCPFVGWQLGTALLAANGDAGMAARALQRAVGSRGFGQWAKAPEQAWIEGLPEAQSFVRRLASKYPFSCPLLGSDVALMLRQANVALAEAYSRQGNYQGAADVYTRLLQDAPPSAPLLRGLGIALARLQRYDEAYKHLRTALEQEDPKTPNTAGYLALCGALGKPTRPEDKARNVAWSIRLLSKFSLPGDADWARLMSSVYAEARSIGLEVAAEDQVRLCEALLSVNATDSEAAAAYAHLAATHPTAVLPEYAYLYARAAQLFGVTSKCDLELFGLLFRNEPATRAFFTARGWDLDEAAFVYLERCAAQRPGRFPEELGADFAPRGEQLLLERSRRHAEASRDTAALATAEVLLKLAPGSGRAHDWLANLHYRANNWHQAVTLLSDWRRLEPANHVPLVRQAVIEQRLGNVSTRSDLIHQALERTTGSLRAAIACLGARLALQLERRSLPEPGTNGTTEGHAPLAFSSEALASAEQLLQEALKEDPGHTEALWQLAAVRSVRGDQAGLAALAPAMDRPGVEDSRFHYLAAVCQLAAGQYRHALEAAERAGSNPELAADCHYLTGWAYLHLNETRIAVQTFEKAAEAGTPSAEHARALLGKLRFSAGDSETAIQCWAGINPMRRQQWKLDEPLRGTVFVTALEALNAGQYEKAAERIREAGRLGWRDRRLGALMTLALVKAGQRLLYES